MDFQGATLSSDTGLALSTTRLLPDSVWPWLAGGYLVDGERFDRLLCPETGIFAVFYIIYEKLALSEKLQASRLSSMPTFQAKVMPEGLKIGGYRG